MQTSASFLTKRKVKTYVSLLSCHISFWQWKWIVFSRTNLLAAEPVWDLHHVNTTGKHVIRCFMNKTRLLSESDEKEKKEYQKVNELVRVYTSS